MVSSFICLNAPYFNTAFNVSLGRIAGRILASFEAVAGSIAQPVEAAAQANVGKRILRAFVAEADSIAPRITPARGPPIWNGCGTQAQMEGVDAIPDWDMANQSALDRPEDQRTDW